MCNALLTTQYETNMYVSFHFCGDQLQEVGLHLLLLLFIKYAFKRTLLKMTRQKKTHSKYYNILIEIEIIVKVSI